MPTPPKIIAELHNWKITGKVETLQGEISGQVYNHPMFEDGAWYTAQIYSVSTWPARLGMSSYKLIKTQAGETLICFATLERINGQRAI